MKIQISLVGFFQKTGIKKLKTKILEWLRYFAEEKVP